VFWWQVLHNSLPSKLELKRRHVGKESFCEVCGDPTESVFHVVTECSVARSFWDVIKQLSGVKLPQLHPCSWPTDILRPEVCSTKTAEAVICGAWVLWTGRNNRNHDRKTWKPGAMARYIASLIEELATLKIPTPVAKPRRLMR
jgi:hypothetical protein